MALLGWRFEVSFVDADVDLVMKAIVVSVGGVFFFVYIYMSVWSFLLYDWSFGVFRFGSLFFFAS
jgi:hypothetical protein